MNSEKIIPTIENVEKEFNNQNEESLEERFSKMVAKLQSERGWSPRKAVRYLNSIAKRNLKKTLPKVYPKVARQICKRFTYVKIEPKKKVIEETPIV